MNQEKINRINELARKSKSDTGREGRTEKTSYRICCHHPHELKSTAGQHQRTGRRRQHYEFR